MLDFTPATDIPPAIAGAASFVASASARLEAATRALADAEAAERKVRGRIAALEQERAAIAARRARGEHQHDDGGRLELIRLDLEGLITIAAEAEADVTEVRQKVEAEHRIAANARSQLTRAEGEVTLQALEQHAGQLDALMETTIRQMTETATRIGARVAYAPSPALATAFRRLLAAAGRL